MDSSIADDDCLDNLSRFSIDFGTQIGSQLA